MVGDRSPTPSVLPEPSGDRYARLLQEMGEAVIVTDPEGRVTEWNRRAEELYGWSADEVIGRSIYEVTVPEPALAEAQDIMAQLARGQSWSGDFAVRRRDGSTFTAHVTDAPVHDAEGRLVAIIGLSEDVSERKAVEQMKDEFIGLVSHELRSPLTVISGMAERLVRRYGGEAGDRDEVLASGLEDIRSAAARLRSVVDNLITLAFAGHEAVEREPVDLGEVARRVVGLRREGAPRRSFVLTVEDGLPPAAGNETWVDQIVTNLVTNAEKYSPEGEAVEVRVEQERAGILAIRVLDRGRGIDEADVEALFEPFRRGSSDAPGIGLGLTVARRLAEIQSGTIAVAPRSGGGSEFALILPCWGSGDDAGPPAEASSVGASPAGASPAGGVDGVGNGVEPGQR